MQLVFVATRMERDWLEHSLNHYPQGEQKRVCYYSFLSHILFFFVTCPSYHKICCCKSSLVCYKTVPIFLIQGIQPYHLNCRSCSYILWDACKKILWFWDHGWLQNDYQHCIFSRHDLPILHQIEHILLYNPPEFDILAWFYSNFLLQRCARQLGNVLWIFSTFNNSSSLINFLHNCGCI